MPSLRTHVTVQQCFWTDGGGSSWLSTITSRFSSERGGEKEKERQGLTPVSGLRVCSKCQLENRDRELEENSDLNGIRTNLSGLCVNDPAENMAQTK
eukprot:scaffold899_cov90-Skeletonema_dohrnii-CCMP3373.AAC.2